MRAGLRHCEAGEIFGEKSTERKHTLPPAACERRTGHKVTILIEWRRAFGQIFRRHLCDRPAEYSQRDGHSSDGVVHRSGDYCVPFGNTIINAITSVKMFGVAAFSAVLFVNSTGAAVPDPPPAITISFFVAALYRYWYPLPERETTSTKIGVRSAYGPRFRAAAP